MTNGKPMFRNGGKRAGAKTLAAMVVALMAVPTAALANAFVPLPVLWFGTFFTALGPLWLTFAMAICICIEWVAYRAMHIVSHPLQISLRANLMSALAGIPVCILSVPLGDPILLPTLTTLVVEVLYVRAIIKRETAVGGKAPARWRWAGTVLGANILSTAVMVACLVGALARFPLSSWARFQCSRNLGVIQEAKDRYERQSPSPSTNAPTWQDLRPFLSTSKPLRCMKRGAYSINPAGVEPACSVHGSLSDARAPR